MIFKDDLEKIFGKRKFDMTSMDEAAANVKGDFKEKATPKNGNSKKEDVELKKPASKTPDK